MKLNPHLLLAGALLALNLAAGPTPADAKDITLLNVSYSTRSSNHELPRYLFPGPQGEAKPMRIGIFAGLHGDEPAASFALLRFVRFLEENPEIARGYCLFLYPVSNPTGFADNTRHNRNGKDLNREFWRHSAQPEVRLLESELWSPAFHGLISVPPAPIRQYAD